MIRRMGIAPLNQLSRIDKLAHRIITGPDHVAGKSPVVLTGPCMTERLVIKQHCLETIAGIAHTPLLMHEVLQISIDCKGCGASFEVTKSHQ